MNNHEGPILEINTLSAAGTSKAELLRTASATERMITNLKMAEEVLSPVFGEHNVTASLHTGRKLDTTRAAERLIQAGIPVTSFDSPDVRPIGPSIKEALVDFFARKETRLNMQRLMNHAGWNLFAVGSEEQLIGELDKTMEVVTKYEQQVPFIVRTSSQSLEKDEVMALARRVHDLRESGVKAFMSVETPARNLSPSEFLSKYWQFRKDLAQHGLDDDLLMISIDPAHLEESRDQFKDQEIPHSARIVEQWLDDSSLWPQIAAIELNQYQSGAVETHANILTAGEVDLMQIAHSYGRADAQHKLVSDARYILETHPAQYQLAISEGGVEFFKGVLKAHKGN